MYREGRNHILCNVELSVVSRNNGLVLRERNAHETRIVTMEIVREQYSTSVSFSQDTVVSDQEPGQSASGTQKSFVACSSLCIPNTDRLNVHEPSVRQRRKIDLVA